MRFKQSTLRWVLKKSKPLVPSTIAVCILGMVSAICGVLVALQSKTLIDSAVSYNIESFTKAIIGLVGLIVIHFIGNAGFMKISANAAAKYGLRLQREVFDNVMHMKYKDITEYHTGQLMNRIGSDADSVISGIIGIVPCLFTFLTELVGAFIALYVIEPKFAILCFVMGLLVATGVAVFGKRLKRYAKECRTRSDEVNSFMMESIQNIIPIKSFLNEDKIVNKAKTIQKKALITIKKRNNANILARLSASFVFSFGYYLAMGWGAFSILSGSFSYGNLVAMLQLVNQIQNPFKDISSIIPQYYAVLASAERLIELSNREWDKAESKVPIPEFEKIKFENITFGYEDELIFENMNFEINKNQFCALVGISGIGKSTLLKLLLGIYTPNSGRILIVKADGTEEILSNKYRSLFSYVPQGNMILSGSIRDNVVFFNDNNDESKVIECLKLASLWEDVCEMPDGINTKIGENGTGISEGQAQRVAIARALYYDAPVMLFDEATSALDSVTEKSVLSNIRKMNNKTCILVSHKIATDEIVDIKAKIDNKNMVW